MLPTNQHPEAILDFLASRSHLMTRLRLAKLDDADFILSLRLNPARSAHISATSASLQEQRAWMQSYESRFEAGREAYFIIQQEGKDVGTVRLYDYRPTLDSFCWGSWVIKPGVAESAAFATPLIIYDLGFNCLDFSSAHFDIRNANTSVWKFEEMLGAELIGEDALNRRYTYSRRKYPAARARLLRLSGITL